MTDAATDWLAAGDSGLKKLLEGVTYHHKVQWNVPDYIDDHPDEREVVPTLEEAEAVSSLKKGYEEWPLPENRFHALMFDIDVPAWLVPSSTPGHSHLYVDLHIPEDKLWAFLEAAADIGLVEEGYVSACKSRGMTSLRAPWVRKGMERPINEPEGF